jgi:hypothetical protein
MPFSDCISRLSPRFRSTALAIIYNVVGRQRNLGLQSTDMYIEMPFSDCISRLMKSEKGISQSTDQKTASLYTYQSTYAIRKWHIIAVLYTYQSTDAIRKRHLSVDWSENGISIYISVDLCNQKTAYYCCFIYCTYQSTDAISKRHIIAVLHTYF